MDLDEVSSTFPSHSLLLITLHRNVIKLTVLILLVAGGMYNDDLDLQKPC